MSQININTDNVADMMPTVLNIMRQISSVSTQLQMHMSAIDSSIKSQDNINNRIKRVYSELAEAHNKLSGLYDLMGYATNGYSNAENKVNNLARSSKDISGRDVENPWIGIFSVAKNGVENVNDVFSVLSKDPAKQLLHYLLQKGLYVEQRGEYYIVHGAAEELKKAGNLGRRYLAENANKYENLKNLLPKNNFSESFGKNFGKNLSEDLKIFEKGKGLKLGGLLNYLGMALDVGTDVTHELSDPSLKNKPRETVNAIASDTVVDVGLDVSNIAVSEATCAAVGGAIGTFIPIPIVGTVVGAAAGVAVGIVFSKLTTEWKPFEGGKKSISDELKSGVKNLLNFGENEGKNAIESVGKSAVNGVTNCMSSVSSFFKKASETVGSCSIGKSLFCTV